MTVQIYYWSFADIHLNDEVEHDNLDGDETAIINTDKPPTEDSKCISSILLIIHKKKSEKKYIRNGQYERLGFPKHKQT